MAILQVERTWVDLLDRFGWPSLMLVGVGIVVWKWFIPFITRQIERREEDLKAFLASMESHRQGLDSVVDTLKSLGNGIANASESIKALRDEIQAKKRRQNEP